MDLVQEYSIGGQKKQREKQAEFLQGQVQGKIQILATQNDVSVVNGGRKS